MCYRWSMVCSLQWSYVPDSMNRLRQLDWCCLISAGSWLIVCLSLTVFLWVIFHMKKESVKSLVQTVAIFCILRELPVLIWAMPLQEWAPPWFSINKNKIPQQLWLISCLCNTLNLQSWNKFVETSGICDVLYYAYIFFSPCSEEDVWVRWRTNYTINSLENM